MIAYEANIRWQNPPVINPTPIYFLVAIFGLIANFYTVLILKPKKHKHQTENENILILYIHMIFDTIGSFIVLIGAIEIIRTGNYFIDPMSSFVLAGLIVLAAILMSWELIRGHNH